MTRRAQLLCVSGWCEGGRALEQSGGMMMKSVVTRNGGHRGWRHEGAVTMATKERRSARRCWRAGGGGHRGWLAA